MKHKKQYNEQPSTVCEDMAEGWLLYSGASGHMCPFKEEFSELRPLKDQTYISIANGNKVSAGGLGTVPVILKNKTPIRIENLVYVDPRLLSIPALAEKGLDVSFGRGICQIGDNEREKRGRFVGWSVL